MATSDRYDGSRGGKARGLNSGKADGRRQWPDDAEVLSSDALFTPIVIDSAQCEGIADLRRRLLDQAVDGRPRLLLIEESELDELRPHIDANPLMDFVVKPISPMALDTRISKLADTVAELSRRRIELDRLQTEMDRLAFYDRLTDLPNNEFFRRHLAYQLRHAERYSRQLAVLAIDLRSFERVHSLLGQKGVASLLHEAGGRIVREVRSHDVVGQAPNIVPLQDEQMVTRLDGDRFLVLLSEFRHIKDVTTIVERLIEAIAEPIQLNGQAFTPDPKVGISIYPSDGESEEELIRHAHSALEFSRSHRLGRYGFFAESMNQLIADRFSMESRLRAAIDEQAFELCYQPKVSLLDGTTKGMEALVRWRDEELGSIAPGKFIPLAEELGLINEISRWVIEEVCRQSKRWREAGVQPVPIAINLSGQDFLRSDFPDFITGVLLDYDVSPRHIELEITEGVVIRNIDAAATMLEELRKIGLTIALDDFGTGYSSLGYLHRIPIDTLKIDRSFIRNITEDWNCAAITSGVITLSHILNLNVVAEGVETQEQVELLKDQNCNEIQGSICSMPLTPDMAARWLRAGSAS